MTIGLPKAKSKRSKKLPPKSKSTKAPRRLGRPKAEQLDLIPDARPANEKEIARVANDYRMALREQCAALSVAKERKEELLALVKEAKLTPTDDGKIQFHAGGLLIMVTPRDELVRVKDETGDEDDDADDDDDASA